jgi:hypothetical protein
MVEDFSMISLHKAYVLTEGLPSDGLVGELLLSNGPTDKTGLLMDNWTCRHGTDPITILFQTNSQQSTLLHTAP